MSKTSNLFLFRHIAPTLHNRISNRILVSSSYSLPLASSELLQRYKCQPNTSLRQDHWTPMAVLTGIRSEKVLHHFIERLSETAPLQPLQPQPTQHKPKISATDGNKTIHVRAVPQTGYWSFYKSWETPQSITDKVNQLVNVLQDDLVQDEFASSGDATIVDSGDNGMLYIFWERPEYYQDLADQFPGFVMNLKLDSRGGHPILPGVTGSNLNQVKKDLKHTRLQVEKEKQEFKLRRKMKDHYY